MTGTLIIGGAMGSAFILSFCAAQLLRRLYYVFRNDEQAAALARQAALGLARSTRATAAAANDNTPPELQAVGTDATTIAQ